MACAAMAASLLAGCAADECRSGKGRCIDNVAESCVAISDSELSSHTEWMSEPCWNGFCQTAPSSSQAGAFCALDPALDPSCPPELQSRRAASRCIGSSVRTWTYGYRVAELDCGALACVDQAVSGFDPSCDDFAFCSPSREPDPLCTEGVVTACADERTIVYCSCNFRRDAHLCESPGPSCQTVAVAEGAAPQGVCR